jgi:hypothetical protein
MSFTYPDNFFYPDDSSDNNLTQHIQNLAASVQTKFTDQETWVSWTPSWFYPANGGTQAGISAVGTGGHMSGYYRRSYFGADSIIHAEFHIYMGTTAPTIVSPGAMTFYLPVEAYNWGGAANACQNATVGHWCLRDNNSSPVNHYQGTIGLWFDDNGTVAHFSGVPAPHAATSDKSSRYRMDTNDPVSLEAGDQFTGQLMYRTA